MSKTIELEIKDVRGLHSKKCLAICKSAQEFTSTIILSHNGNTVDIKSILGLLSLACPQGAKVSLIAEGEDANEAITKLEEIVC